MERTRPREAYLLTKNLELQTALARLYAVALGSDLPPHHPALVNAAEVLNRSKQTFADYDTQLADGEEISPQRHREHREEKRDGAKRFLEKWRTPEIQSAVIRVHPRPKP